MENYRHEKFVIGRKRSFLACAIVSMAIFASSAVPAFAYDPVEVLDTVPAQGTVEIKYTNGKTEVSTPLWSGNIPSRVRAIKASSYSSCFELKFPIQALRPYAEIIDASTSVDIDFELWTANGEKLATKWVYSSTWNPLGGQTMVVWTECEWEVPGSYNLIVKTKQTVSTTGLLSRYLSGMQIVPLVIDPPSKKASTVECKKGKTTKSFKRAKCPAGWKATS